MLARVRALREALELSQEAFAEKAGLKYKHYQSMEAGRKIDIRFSTLEKLAKACRLEPWELLNLESEPAILAEPPDEEPAAKSSPKSRRR